MPPGSENELPPRSVTAALGAIALGLAAGAIVTQAWRERRDGKRPTAG